MANRGRSTRLDSAFALLRSAVEQRSLPCAVLAVADQERVLRSEAFSPPTGDYRVAEDSQFLIASVTKPIVASAVMRLIERGQLRLAEPVARLVPAFDQREKASITPWHLLTHSSGISERFAAELWARRAPRDRYLEGLYDAPLDFEPGSRFHYGTQTFRLLGEILERTCGAACEEVLRQEVFQPLGMADTSFDSTSVEVTRRIPCHGPPEFDPPYYASLANPGGGLHSTAEDVVRFGQGMLRAHLGAAAWLSTAAVRTMTRLHTGGLLDIAFSPPVKAMYGLGVAKTGSSQTMPSGADLATPDGFGHAGAAGSFLWIEPALRLVFVLLTNQWGIDAATLRDRALNAAIAAVSVGE
jgi:CubicO group peptidase (beta-lactamase class C family)